MMRFTTWLFGRNAIVRASKSCSALPVLSAVKLHTYTSSVTPARSGQVWIARCDSASRIVPVMPPGCPFQSGKTCHLSSTIVSVESLVALRHSVESVSRSVSKAALQPHSNRSPVR